MPFDNDVTRYFACIGCILYTTCDFQSAVRYYIINDAFS